jgi:hypothetical protein
MNETEASKPIEESELPTKPIEESEPPTTNIDIITPEGRKIIFELLCMARGIDPSQVQGMAKFMNPDSVDETTYYATQRTVVSIAQLRLYSESFYKGEEWNEYEFAADILGTGFKGFKGFKSVQYKDITSGQPNLDKLQGLPEETKQGVLAGIFGRKKE